MKNNTLPLVLTRISLAITLLYIGSLFFIVSPSGPITTDGVGVLLAFLYPHLCALAIAAILNIIISLEGSINRMLIGITLIFYIIAGILGTIFIPFLGFLTIPAVSIQVILLIISICKFK